MDDRGKELKRNSWDSKKNPNRSTVKTVNFLLLACWEVMNNIKGSFPRVMSLNHVGLPRNYVNPLIPNIHIQILQTDLHTFP